jgi:hypothetical protein
MSEKLSDSQLENLSIYIGRAGTGQKVTADNKGTALVEAWILDAKGHSPAWWHFMIAVIHLRDVENLGRATKRFPQATHELTVQALDSQTLPLPSDKRTWKFLTPVNVVWQFTANDDAQAALACRKLAVQALEGQLFLEPQGVSGAQDHWAMWLKSCLSPGARIE